jgi:8-oxo-dGTP pyrophosphatase MutT (NUDIX family)
MDLNKANKTTVIESAVMVLHELSTDSLILTRRNDQLRHHPGEISFPGGVREKQDHSLYDTALRELYEELNIDKDRLVPVKALEVERTLNGILIYPWLATIDAIEPYSMNIQEVTAIVSVPITLVKQANNYRDISVERHGLHFKSCEFIPYEGIIWGATARIMKQLIDHE